MADNKGMERELAKDKPWQSAYAYVQECAINHLNHLQASQTIPTKKLVEALYTSQGSYEEHIHKRIYQALKALATRGLADYMTLGPATVIHGKIAHRKMWHASQKRPALPAEPKEKCFNCGKEM